MRNSLFVILTLAFVSLAQAGPFGVKDGMTASEILKAGFKTDEKRRESMTGINIIADQHSLEELKAGVPKKRPWHKTYAFHSDHPNKVFEFNVDAQFGLTGFSAVTVIRGKEESFDEQEEASKILFQEYKRTLLLKYKKAWSEESPNNITMDFPTSNENNITLISVGCGKAMGGKYLKETKRPRPISSLRVGDDRVKDFHFVKISYRFKSDDLVRNRKSKNEGEALLEKIKDLLPKEEDL